MGAMVLEIYFYGTDIYFYIFFHIFCRMASGDPKKKGSERYVKRSTPRHFSNSMDDVEDDCDSGSGSHFEEGLASAGYRNERGVDHSDLRPNNLVS